MSNDRVLIEYLQGAGRPLSHETRGTFMEIIPLKRLKIQLMIDFIQGLELDEYNLLVEFVSEWRSVRMISTVDQHHDEQRSRLAALGWESQRAKLQAALAARAKQGGDS